MVLSLIGSLVLLNASSCPCPCLKACFPGLFSQQQKSKLPDKELEEQLRVRTVSYEQHQEQKAKHHTDDEELYQLQPDISISPPSHPMLARLPLSDIATHVTQQQLPRKAIIKSVNSLSDISPISSSSTRPPSARSSQEDIPALALSASQHLVIPNASHQVAKKALPQAKTFSTISSCSDCSEVRSINEEDFVYIVMTPNGTDLVTSEDPLDTENPQLLPTATASQGNVNALPGRQAQRTPTPSLGGDDDNEEKTKEHEAFMRDLLAKFMESTLPGLQPLVPSKSNED